MGVTTIEFYLNKFSSTFQISKFLNNKIINNKKTFQDKNYLFFIHLSSFDSYSMNLLNNDFRNEALIINTTIPINVYYPSLQHLNILGYIDRTQFDENTIPDLFSKIDNNKKYISDCDKEILLDYSFFNKSKTDRNSIIKKLSLQEYVVLENLLIGKSINQIAADMNLHKSSISTYKKRVLQKCSVENILDLKNFFNISN